MKPISFFLMSSMLLGLLIPTRVFSQTCVDSTLINPSILCPAIWAPVCGCDGTTFGNDCEAVNFGGMTSWVDGECTGTAQDCLDLGGIDFGLCDMVMGVALINGSCQGLSGCGWGVGDMDYSPYSFANLEDCIAYCGNEAECIDPTLADPLIDCNIFNPFPVCGCDSLTHFNECVVTYVDWVSDFNPGTCPGDCYDASRVVDGINCPEDNNFVCGCDSLTYLSACEAWYSGGLAQWTEGPCETSGIDPSAASTRLQIAPTPSHGVFLISAIRPTAAWQVYNSTGTLVLQGAGQLVNASLSAGCYILYSEGFLPVRLIVQ